MNDPLMHVCLKILYITKKPTAFNKTEEWTLLNLKFFIKWYNTDNEVFS